MGGSYMPTRIPLPPSGFDDLTADEKVDYVQSLWDRIAGDSAEMPVPDWHRAVIKQRLEDRKSSPNDVVGWKEARESIARELRDRNTER